MNKEIIGQNIHNLRVQNGLTQAQLAEEIDKSTIHVSHIENGLTSISLECLLALCDALKTTPNIILQGTYHSPDKIHNILTDSDAFSPAPMADTQNLAREIADIIMERLEK